MAKFIFVTGGIGERYYSSVSGPSFEGTGI